MNDHEAAAAASSSFPDADQTKTTPWQIVNNSHGIMGWTLCEIYGIDDPLASSSRTSVIDCVSSLRLPSTENIEQGPPRQTGKSVAARPQDANSAAPSGLVCLQAKPVAVSPGTFYPSSVEGHNLVNRWLSSHRQCTSTPLADSSHQHQHQPSLRRGHHHHPYKPQSGVPSFSDSTSGCGGGLSTMASCARSSAPPSFNYLNPFQGLPRHGMHPSMASTADPNSGLALFIEHTESDRDSASGNGGSLSSRDLQDVRSSVTTLAQSSLGAWCLDEIRTPCVTQSGAGDEKGRGREREVDIDANGCSLSPLLTANDCASILLQNKSEPICDSDLDSGWDVGPGDPWATPISSSTCRPQQQKVQTNDSDRR